MAAISSIGYQQLTVSTGAVKLTPPTSQRPRRALIFVGPVSGPQPIRMREDAAPTSTTGYPVAGGSIINLAEGLDEYDAWGTIQGMQFIKDSTATGDATLEILYFQ